MALEEFVSGEYTAGDGEALIRAVDRGTRTALAATNAIIEAAWSGGRVDLIACLRSMQEPYRPVATFRLCELPVRWRQRAVRNGRRDWYVCRRGAAVPELAVMGVTLPLHPQTPWGIVGDYVTDNLPATADNRLLARLCWKVQDGMDKYYAEYQSAYQRATDALDAPFAVGGVGS